MKIALAGQPNCGKSTIFNHIAGYKAITSNFPGTTVKYTLTKIRLNEYDCECIDLPGTYSLTSEDLAELETREHLLSGEVDVIINVVDASLLCRSLELTLQLLELEVPMVLCLNMMDEAQRKGIQIGFKKLAELLGIPVIPTIAVKGKGLKELFNEVIKVYENKRKGKIIKFSKDVEEIIEQMNSFLDEQSLITKEVPGRFLAIKLLEDDPFILKKIEKSFKDNSSFKSLRDKLAQAHGVPSDQVISSERHALAMNLFEKATTIIHPPQKDMSIIIDNFLMHKYFSYFFLSIFFYGFFNLVFGIGGYIEEPLMHIFEKWIEESGKLFGKETLPFYLCQGGIQGIAGGIAIVLPYLVPFLIGLSFLEDIGYLPRVAFLMDVFMHRIGLHGKSIIPLILGYGCSVPAVMATRILEFPEHRFMVSILATIVPCAARITIIFGLVAYFISPNAALVIFVLNILVIALTGKVFSKIYPEATLGLILEIPAYRLPTLENVLKKSWFRIREFIIMAWPILIGGSILLALMEYGGLEKSINWFLSPLTNLLGLPTSTGTTLIFGLLRKELTMIMLMQSLGTPQILTVMSKSQIMVFTVFVTFYIPCLATIGALNREIGKKGTLLAILFTFFIAVILSLGTRLIISIYCF
ncbi:MAG: ferrous iron transport protein B [Thermodesulfobacteriota bacterium]